MQIYIGNVLFYLFSSVEEKQDFLTLETSFRSIISDVRVFDDVDRCVDELTEIGNETIFLILGQGRSYLVDILADFSYLRYIYLRPSNQDETITHNIRGVFSTTQQLLQQLKEDVRFTVTTNTHPFVGASILSYRNHQIPLEYIHELLGDLLHIPRPTCNVYQDLIREGRLLYPAQQRLITAFERTYQSSSAIWWYTRDSFLYKLLNMALRTIDLVMMWKLRFFIQDLFNELKKMNDVQRNPQRRRWNVYRGQRMSSEELQQITASIDRYLTMASFISTTKRREVAERYADAGEEQSDYKFVLFEITIDENELDDDHLPFADISARSYFGQEEEVLLCMGTVMRILSVENIDQVSHIYLNMCPYDYASLWYPHQSPLTGNSNNVNTEQQMSLDYVRGIEPAVMDAKLYKKPRLSNPDNQMNTMLSEDKSIEFFLKALQLFSDPLQHVPLYTQMIEIYEQQQNWYGMIKYSQLIITLPQLPANSIDLFHAYLRTAKAYLGLNNQSKAVTHYSKAAALLKQYHSSNQSLHGEFHLEMGDAFGKVQNYESALDSYRKAILLDLPEVTYKAYFEIALIHYDQGNYDLARQYLITYIDFFKDEFSPSIISVLLIAYELLIEIEHKTANSQQRDDYIRQTLALCINNDELQKLAQNSIETILKEGSIFSVKKFR